MRQLENKKGICQIYLKRLNQQVLTFQKLLNYYLYHIRIKRKYLTKNKIR